jgi:hypothetical protein
MDIDRAIHAIQQFQGKSLTGSISEIEKIIVGFSEKDAKRLCIDREINDLFLASALSIKKLAGQINVIIHAASILRSLPEILEPGEVIESVSLGAGNTGRKFDLETNYRIAEYKFIDWNGGAETIRQNGIFKDFFELAETDTNKKKYLYVIGDIFPLKFFLGGRSITSVLSRNPKILQKIRNKYGDEVLKVRDYYILKSSEVYIVDISPHIGRNIRV